MTAGYDPRDAGAYPPAAYPSSGYAPEQRQPADEPAPEEGADGAGRPGPLPPRMEPAPRVYGSVPVPPASPPGSAWSAQGSASAPAPGGEPPHPGQHAAPAWRAGSGASPTYQGSAAPPQHQPYAPPAQPAPASSPGGFGQPASTPAPGGFGQSAPAPAPGGYGQPAPGGGFAPPTSGASAPASGASAPAWGASAPVSGMSAAGSAGTAPASAAPYGTSAPPYASGSPFAPDSAPPAAPPAARPRTWPGLVAFILVLLLVAVAVLQAVQINGLNDKLAAANKRNSAAQSSEEGRLGALEDQASQLAAQAGKVFNPEAIASAVLPSVFRVKAGNFLGTAFAVGKPASGGGTNLYTNFHVVEASWKAGQKEVELERQSDTFSATIVEVDEDNDVAHLQTSEKFTGLQIADKAVKSGQQIVVVGSPLGLTDSVTTGVVSAFRKNPDGEGTVIQFDAPINPGNSGGPVINGEKKVVGIATAKARDAEGIGLAIPIATACELIPICK